jgi:hypothetical protein
MARENKLSKLSDRAHKVIELHAKLPGWLTSRNHRVGGYLTCLNTNTGVIDSIFKVAHVEREKADKYYRFSEEKAVRLLSRIEKPGDKTSHDSMNVDDHQYPGAIFCPHLNKILSFSGLPMYSDEACMFALSVLMIEDDEIRSEWISEIYQIYAQRGDGDHRKGLVVFTHLMTALHKEYEKDFYLDSSLAA